MARVMGRAGARLESWLGLGVGLGLGLESWLGLGLGVDERLVPSYRLDEWQRQQPASVLCPTVGCVVG